MRERQRETEREAEGLRGRKVCAWRDRGGRKGRKGRKVQVWCLVRGKRKGPAHAMIQSETPKRARGTYNLVRIYIVKVL